MPEKETRKRSISVKGNVFSWRAATHQVITSIPNCALDRGDCGELPREEPRGLLAMSSADRNQTSYDSSGPIPPHSKALPMKRNDVFMTCSLSSDPFHDFQDTRIWDVFQCW